MTGDAFKIFVQQLKNGQTEIIEETFSPDFLDVHEDELAFSSPVDIKGEAELADAALVLRLAVKTEATMPCAICNEKIEVKLEIPEFCYSVEVSEIKGDVFNFKEILREVILLELPPRAECNEGNCPERGLLSKYFSRS